MIFGSLLNASASALVSDRMRVYNSDKAMGLSKHYLDTQNSKIDFEPRVLADLIEKRFPGISFAYILGSAAGGTVPPHGDVDIAVYAEIKPDLNFYLRLEEACGEAVGPVRCDIGILNHADPVYRFEALKGFLLFARDREKWLTFYSRACREYEHWMYHYEKQRRYRIEHAR